MLLTFNTYSLTVKVHFFKVFSSCLSWIFCAFVFTENIFSNVVQAACELFAFLICPNIVLSMTADSQYITFLSFAFHSFHAFSLSALARSLSSGFFYSPKTNSKRSFSIRKFVTRTSMTDSYSCTTSQWWDFHCYLPLCQNLIPNNKQVFYSILLEVHSNTPDSIFH